MRKLIKDQKDFFQGKSRRNSEGGFTIIEVLIVLAIAGLILLIVFLAVPALQRNSRNTQRKNDVSSLLGAVNEFTSNNQGALPDTDVERADVLESARPGYYDADNLGTAQGQVSFGTSTSTLTDAAADDRAIIAVQSRCVDAGGAVEAGSARQVAVLYQIETSGDPDVVCQES